MAEKLSEPVSLHLSQITSARLERIFQIYDQAVGGSAQTLLNENPVGYHLRKLDELRFGIRSVEIRAGSDFSPESKLVFKRNGVAKRGEDSLVTLEFVPNVITKDMSGAGLVSLGFNMAMRLFFIEEGLIEK